jgi:hypothetical protein
MADWTDADRANLREKWVVFSGRTDAECNAALDKRPNLIEKTRSTFGKKARSEKRGDTREERGGRDRSEG